MSYEDHGWRHRPKERGGTDPIPPFTTWAKGTGNTAQTVTETTELVFDNFRTNDQSTFGWDESGDPSGILIRSRGLYMVLAHVAYDNTDDAVERDMYVHWDALSSGVTFGSELLPAIGAGQNSSSIGIVSSIPSLIEKVNLDYFSIAELFATGLDSDPFRAAVVLGHNGTDYDTASSESTLTIVKLSTPRTFFDGTP